MSAPSAQPEGSGSQSPSLVPIGKLGFRGRRVTPEEQAQVFDAFFFEGKRRIPYAVHRSGDRGAPCVMPLR